MANAALCDYTFYTKHWAKSIWAYQHTKAQNIRIYTMNGKMFQSRNWSSLSLSLSLPHFRWAHSLSLRFPVYNYFCICAVELELRSLYLCENLAYLVCDSMAVGMHVSYSCLHAPIKIVIQVNFESKNINKCHPFSHILCLFSSKYECAYIYAVVWLVCVWMYHFRFIYVGRVDCV